VRAQAKLATDLVADDDFSGSAEQIGAMRRGLGLDPPDEFWTEVGTRTADMEADDKVALLAFIVPKFGLASSSSPLAAFVSGLAPAVELVQGKCPDLSPGEAQFAASEMLACEVLTGGSSKEEFAKWASAMTAGEVKAYADARRQFKRSAEESVEAIRAARQAEADEIERAKTEMEQQIMAAREVRTIAFNYDKGKFEPWQDPDTAKKFGLF
jgi:hypothetical protein